MTPIVGRRVLPLWLPLLISGGIREHFVRLFLPLESNYKSEAMFFPHRLHDHGTTLLTDLVSYLLGFLGNELSDHSKPSIC